MMRRRRLSRRETRISHIAATRTKHAMIAVIELSERMYRDAGRASNARALANVKGLLRRVAVDGMVTEL